MVQAVRQKWAEEQQAHGDFNGSLVVCEIMIANRRGSSFVGQHTLQSAHRLCYWVGPPLGGPHCSLLSQRATAGC